MKSLFYTIFICVSLFINIYPQTTIYSTTLGGKWHETITWIGGIVPGSSENIIIQGPVIQQYVTGYDIHSVYCNDLTITNSGSLSNGDYGGGAGTFPVYVGGNVVNDGVVANGSDDYLKIFIAGDIENNNIWRPYETEFHTSQNHNLSLAVGKSFGSRIINYSPTLTALTDLYFTCDWSTGSNLYRDHFYLNNQTLVLGNHSIELYPTCLINKGKLLGDFEILGTFTTGWAEGYDIRDTLVFEGDITVTDTLKANTYGGGYGIYKLKVDGNLTNNGVIKDDVDADVDGILNADDLNILITGNINNNGLWTNNYITLIGTNTQNISQSLDKKFDSYFVSEKSDGDITANSNIDITKDFNLNGSLLNMQNFKLSIYGWLYNGSIIKTGLHNGYLQNITSIDELVIEGKVTIDDNNIFEGSVVVQDTLQSNEYGGGSKYFLLSINGDITNNGVIQNINSGDMLSLELYGDAHNNGEWKNSRTRFAGTEEQKIQQSDGKIYQTNFYDLDSTSLITALSDIRIDGNFDLGNTNLFMNGFELELNGDINNGNIHLPVIKNAKLSDVSIYDSLVAKGTLKIGDGNNVYGNLIVTDTLQSIPYGGGSHTYRLNVYGDVNNYGLIRDEPAQGENFAVYVMGDIINQGTFSNYRVYQTFYQNNNSNSIKCFNTSASDWIFSGANITDNTSNAFSITSGGNNQTVFPNQSYDVTIQYTATTGDSTATLNISCTEIGTLSTIYLVGNNCNTTVNMEEEIDKINLTDFVLYQNYPNPFNPSTTIKYSIPSFGTRLALSVQLKIYDILGNEIATLVNEEKSPGTYEVMFNTEYSIKHSASGIYFYKFKAGDYVETKKMILLK